MALTLSDYLGGPDVENRLSLRISDELLKVLLHHRDKDLRTEEALLSVWYEYPGGILPPLDYTGIKEGIFSKKQKSFRIWVAVPRQLLDSPDFGEFYLAR